MQGAQPSALGQPRGVGWGGETGGASEERGHVYAYGWFMLMYGRDQHKILKPLSSNWKKKKNQESREGNFSRMCFVKQCIHPSYSVHPFSSCPQYFPASGSWLFSSGGQWIGASVLAPFIPMNIHCWFPLGLTWQKLVRINKVEDGGRFNFQWTLSLILCSL